MSGFLYRARHVRDHRWASGQASAYIDGELSTGPRTRMERHVGDCAECRRLLAELRRMVDGLGRLPALGGRSDAGRFAAVVRRRLDEPPGA